ncbi:MAG TPA: SdrD B-like domain-containing protein, partial [Anaerolineales bacterium]|nr:SdrD B-like domain-containing protein [Anaerolineales bacterium]
MFRRTFSICLYFLVLTGCGGNLVIESTPTHTMTPLLTVSPTITTTPAPTFTPQPYLAPISYGPDLEDFPSSVNPLTGQEVADPSLLNLPAVLVSISNMPVTTRPQAGPGFVPWIFEIFIGEGTTRFMGVFYGDNLRHVPNVSGGCSVREEIIRPDGKWIGNRVWLDENENGQQDAWELGVGGVCVRLLDAISREVIAETSTDSNGYYAFDIPNTEAIIQFAKSDSYTFTQPNVDDEDRDSDADVNTGETHSLELNSTESFWDAGLILVNEPVPTTSPVVTGTPPNWYIPSEAYVGPIRSGRLTYNQIGGMFPNSCLVYASAAPDIGERLDACEIVYGVDRTTPNSALLTLKRVRELAKENLNPRQPVNYSGNAFSDEVPAGGLPADTINVYYHLYSQSGWQYDPISRTYLRFTDRADTTGELFPATERLTGRQQAFENVIVVFAEHGIFRPGQFEVNLSQGQKQLAYLFRDGQA